MVNDVWYWCTIREFKAATAGNTTAFFAPTSIVHVGPSPDAALFLVPRIYPCVCRAMHMHTLYTHSHSCVERWSVFVVVVNQPTLPLHLVQVHHTPATNSAVDPLRQARPHERSHSSPSPSTHPPATVCGCGPSDQRIDLYTDVPHTGGHDSPSACR